MVKDLCFEIIQTCPNNCLFCSSCAGMDKTKMIDFETFKKVIDHFMSIGGIEEISFSGGEPMLHPRLFDMITYCKIKGIRVVLFTSGVKRNYHMSEIEMQLLKKKIEDEYAYLKSQDEVEFKKVVNHFMAVYNHYNNKEFSAISREEMEYLKFLGLDKIVFDFQGAERETYDYLMGSNNFDKVESSIIRASVVGLETDIHFVPMKSNYRELPDLIELLNCAEIKQLSILNFVPQGRGAENRDKLMLSPAEMQEFKHIYDTCKDSFKGNIRVGIPLLGEDKHKCTAGLDKLVIKYDGTVLPCPAFKEYDLDTLNSYGIKTPNIYDDLDSIQVYNGTRTYPLCKKLHNFD
ncbi:MAG: radical SAM protein, partial [Bacilli bacterium]|nr:radical SAM protein [Bacilli bacterium]